MLEKILDLPVIIQGALGSFLFWVVYETLKRIFSKMSAFIARYDKHWKRESLTFEQLQEIAQISDPFRATNSLIVCIYGALSLAIKGLIYICFGLMTSDILGPISVFAYAFSVIYFFRALAAVQFEISEPKGEEHHKKRINEIKEELKKLEAGKS